MREFIRNHPLPFIISGLACLLLALFLGLSTGTTGFVPFGGLLSSDSWLFAIRAPRVILAALLGGTLAMSGAALQGLLRNPLVSPYTVGVSSGSSLGAVIAIRFGLEKLMGGSLGLFPAAILGGLLTMAMLFGLARGSKRWTGSTLLLAGITISFFCSAMIMFIQYTATYQESFKMVRWLMGTMDFISWREVGLVLPFTAPAVFYLLSTGTSLNLLSLGEETAASSGVDLPRLTLIIFAVISLAVAATVSIAGPIAFVGLIVPHILRLMGATSYRVLLPGALFFGAAFLVFADLIARTALAPQQIPVGVITSLLGGPFFLFLLVSMGSERE